MASNTTAERLPTQSAVVCKGLVYGKEVVWKPFYFKLVISKLHSNKKVKV